MPFLKEPHDFKEYVPCQRERLYGDCWMCAATRVAIKNGGKLPDDYHLPGSDF